MSALSKHALRGSFVLLVFSLAGCASLQRQGDRAFDNGRYKEALEHYDEAEDQGNRDPQMYYKAAQASLKVGDLGGAERFYSKSLELGANNEVAWELANFYVSTSNYVSAVRIYRYLLYRESDKQPVYNNLGTALMYAGLPFDAESYLMVAQHMNPEAPSPYLNLGLLYDKHLRQPWLAVNFYDCYDELTGGNAQNTPMVRQRSSELRERYYRLYQEGLVECGKPYQPGAGGTETDISKLREKVESGLPKEAPESKVPVDAEGAPDEAGPAPDEAPTIERQVTEAEMPNVSPTSSDQLKRGRAAFEGGRWAEAVDAFTSVPLAELAAPDQERLGLSYKEQSNWAMAKHWLELSRATNPTTANFAALAAVYGKLKQPERTKELCAEVDSDADYQSVVKEHCQEAVE